MAVAVNVGGALEKIIFNRNEGWIAVWTLDKIWRRESYCLGNYNRIRMKTENDPTCFLSIVSTQPAGSEQELFMVPLVSLDGINNAHSLWS